MMEAKAFYSSLKGGLHLYSECVALRCDNEFLIMRALR
jgi:hypothetical protein